MIMAMINIINIRVKSVDHAKGPRVDRERDGYLKDGALYEFLIYFLLKMYM